MPDSDLLNLAAQVKSMQQNPTVSTDMSGSDSAPVPSVAPQMPKPNPLVAAAGPYQMPSVRGDDALAQAWGFSQLSPDEKAAAKLFYDSKGMIQAQMQQDPAYSEKFFAGLKGLKGSAATDYVVQQGDRLKMAKLQQLEPNNYNSEEAAKAGFLNSATFGQLSRIMGVADHFINGKPVSEAIDEQAEKLRLLKSQYPNASWIGEVGSYLMPGSPVKYAFEKAASVGAGTVARLLGRVSQNPALLGKIAEAVGAGGAGGATIGGIEGTAGTGNQQLSLDRGLKTSLAQGAAGAAAAGILTGAGNVAAAAPAGILRGVNKGLAAALEQSTGTPMEAIRAFNANPDVIRAAAEEGTQAKIGAKLHSYLMDKNASQLPERIEADNLLDRFPSIDASKTINFLKNFQKTFNPAEDSAVGILNEMGKRFELRIPEGSNGVIPASAMRGIVDDLQEAARNKGAYGDAAGFVGDQLEKASNIALNSVRGTALQMQKAALTPGADDDAMELGQVGKNYLDLMQKTAEKRGLLSFITDAMGSTENMRNKSAARFVSNLFGKNNDLVRSKMAALDDKFGTNFLELAQNAKYAEQLGKGGEPQALPTHRTGASILGTAFGAAGGGLLGMAVGQLVGGAGSEVAAGIGGAKAGEAIGSALSSPKVAASVIGASDKITKFADVMTSNPEVLQRIATSKEHPAVVKGIASRLLKTFYQDGPLSASSSLRLVADTPYFVGLVHAFDLTQQKMQSNQRYNAVKKVEGR